MKNVFKIYPCNTEGYMMFGRSDIVLNIHFQDIRTPETLDSQKPSETPDSETPL